MKKASPDYYNDLKEQYQNSGDLIRKRIEELTQERDKQRFGTTKYYQLSKRISLLEENLEDTYTGLCLLRKR